MRKSKFYIFLAIVTAILLLSTAAICTQCGANIDKAIGGLGGNVDKEPSGTEPGGEQAAAGILSITPKEVYEIIKNNEDYLIIDVRGPEEYAEGHIETAKLIPVSELEDSLGELPDDKPIIVYCRSGKRSRSAADILIENGFGNVYDMGGIIDWQAEGYPVVTGN